jgi:hypothetical protein
MATVLHGLSVIAAVRDMDAPTPLSQMMQTYASPADVRILFCRLNKTQSPVVGLLHWQHYNQVPPLLNP